MVGEAAWRLADAATPVAQWPAHPRCDTLELAAVEEHPRACPPRSAFLCQATAHSRPDQILLPLPALLLHSLLTSQAQWPAVHSLPRSCGVASILISLEPESDFLFLLHVDLMSPNSHLSRIGLCYLFPTVFWITLAVSLYTSKRTIMSWIIPFPKNLVSGTWTYDLICQWNSGAGGDTIQDAGGP